MYRNAKRFMLFVAILAVATAPAMAASLLSLDFTTGTQDMTIGTATQGGTIGGGYGRGNAAYVPATDHGVANIFGATAATMSGCEGWNWTADTAKDVDMTGDNVMFAKIGLVADAANNSHYLWNFCDLNGLDAGGTARTYFPASSSTYGYVNVSLTMPGSTGAVIGGITTPYNVAPAPATLKAALDGKLENTFVWRGAASGTMTTEASGVGSTYYKKTAADIALTKFTGVFPTMCITPSLAYGGSAAQATIYSNVSGQTDNAFPTDTSKVKQGWTRFEVGQTKSSDFNCDYATDASDYNIVLANLGTGSSTDLKTMSQGDASNDGVVDASDYNKVLANLGTTHDTLAPAKAADAIVGNKVPNLKYNPANGQLTISTDGMDSSEGLNSIKITTASHLEALSTTFTTGSLSPDDSAVWTAAGGGQWVQMFFNNAEQWVKIANPRLYTAGSDLLIATYATGLSASEFSDTCVEYSARVGGATITGFTGVTVPEPGTLVLLSIAGVAAAIAALRRRAA